jgi:hypothetical protein
VFLLVVPTPPDLPGWAPDEAPAPDLDAPAVVDDLPVLEDFFYYIFEKSIIQYNNYNLTISKYNQIYNNTYQRAGVLGFWGFGIL